jgi:hypothetical protein
MEKLKEFGFLEKYTVDGKDYGRVPSWGRHQLINNRESPSKIPNPDASPTRDPRVTHATEGEGKGREGKGTKPMPSSGEGEFESFWQAYPRKEGKGAALKAWETKRPPLAETLNALSWQKKSQQWVKDNGQYIPLPATYINQTRWLDQPKHGEGPKQYTDAEIAARRKLIAEGV